MKPSIQKKEIQDINGYREDKKRKQNREENTTIHTVTTWGRTNLK
jgi:hypothetical protein